MRLLLIFTLLFSSLHAQEVRSNQVPQQVLKSFSEKHPDRFAYDWEWKRKKELYRAKFIHAESKYKAYFTADGTWRLTKREISYYLLPEIVQNAIKNSTYSSWEVDDVEEHSSPEHSVFYEIELENRKQEVLLYYLPDGTLINTIQKK